jgi:hypothetical protein
MVKINQTARAILESLSAQGPATLRGAMRGDLGNDYVSRLRALGLLEIRSTADKDVIRITPAGRKAIA